MSDAPHTLWVPGVPVAWARSRQCGKRHFTAPGHRAWMDTVAMHARAYKTSTQFTGPVALTLRFFLPMPSGWSGRKRGLAEGTPVSVKPDLDNLAKCVLDGLDEAGWFAVGDQQVASIEASKVYGVEPGVRITCGPCCPPATAANA